MQETSGGNHRIELAALPIVLLPTSCVSDSRGHVGSIQYKVSAISVISI